MSNVDVTRDAPVKPQLPVDPNVRIPDSVRRAAAAADAYYQPSATQPVDPPTVSTPDPATPPASGNDNNNTAVTTTPATPEPVVEPVVEPVTKSAPAPKTRAKPKASAPTEPVTEPAQAAAPPTDPAELLAALEQAQHQYRSMKGRYDAQIGILGQMQEQMSLMANELTRTQALLNNPANTQPPEPLITDTDRQNYGDDLIDLTRRVARATVEPELDAVRQENKTLQQRLLQDAQLRVRQSLDAEIPNWREINNNPRFKQWLSLPDIYSGVVRKKMLDAAYGAASAPRVIAFFKGFVTDEIATGNMEAPAVTQQPPAAPRQPAVDMALLSAPGRARPASGGNTPAPADDKPSFTRVQIAKFYNDVRAHVYDGRIAEKNSIEQAIFAAQREGRVH